MKKKLWFLFLCMVLSIVMLAGCGKEDDSKKKASDMKMSEELTDGIDSKTDDAAGANDLLIKEGEQKEDLASDDKAGGDTAGESKDSEKGSGELPALDGGEGEGKEPEEAIEEEPEPVVLLTGLHHADLTIKSYGTIHLELDADAAPITVTNFVKLAGEGFYDGLTFHRIIKNFMMQGGDPNGNGTGGSDERIKGEFSMNGVENPISHTRGTISMARSQNYDSASAQFFIMHRDAVSLDGQYAAFGHVMDDESMAVVDQVCQDAKPTDNNGTIKQSEQPVIESIKILD